MTHPYLDPCSPEYKLFIKCQQFFIAACKGFIDSYPPELGFGDINPYCLGFQQNFDVTAKYFYKKKLDEITLHQIVFPKVKQKINLFKQSLLLQDKYRLNPKLLYSEIDRKLIELLEQEKKCVTFEETHHAQRICTQSFLQREIDHARKKYEYFKINYIQRIQFQNQIYARHNLVEFSVYFECQKIFQDFCAQEFLGIVFIAYDHGILNGQTQGQWLEQVKALHTKKYMVVLCTSRRSIIEEDDDFKKIVYHDLGSCIKYHIFTDDVFKKPAILIYLKQKTEHHIECKIPQNNFILVDSNINQKDFAYAHDVTCVKSCSEIQPAQPFIQSQKSIYGFEILELEHKSLQEYEAWLKDQKKYPEIDKTQDEYVPMDVFFMCLDNNGGEFKPKQEAKHFVLPQPPSPCKKQVQVQQYLYQKAAQLGSYFWRRSKTYDQH